MMRTGVVSVAGGTTGCGLNAALVEMGDGDLGPSQRPTEHGDTLHGGGSREHRGRHAVYGPVDEKVADSGYDKMNADRPCATVHTGEELEAAGM